MKSLICFREFPYARSTVLFGGIVSNLVSESTTLLHVIGSEEDIEVGNRRLEEAVEIIGDMEIETKIRSGDPLKEIIKEAREGQYELVVVGSQEVLRLLGSFFRTVTDKVANKVSSNVLVVKGDRNQLRRILIAVGGQRKGPAVVEYGATLTKASRADVSLIHVTNPVPSMYTGMEAMEETLPELLETDTPISQHLRWSARYLDEQGINAELIVQQGIAADEIMREANLGDYDLIVIGAPSSINPLRKILLHQVTPQIVERASCPVLIVR